MGLVPTYRGTLVVLNISVDFARILSLLSLIVDPFLNLVTHPIIWFPSMLS